MKKLIYLFLVASSIYNVAGMDCWPSDESLPQGANTQAIVPAQQQAPHVAMDNSVNHQGREEQGGWGLLEFVPSPAAVFNGAVNLLRDSMDQLDEAVGAGALERHQEANRNAEHVAFLLEELKHKTLTQAIDEAAKQADSQRFISLLIGMKAQGMQPTQESKQLIHQKLNYLQLLERQETRELLEQRMKKEREIHSFRADYKNAGEKLSDDESYTDFPKYADRLVDDEE